MSNPLASPLPWDLVAVDYAECTAPFFANYAEKALDLAQLPEKSHVLDVAAGPGTLTLLAAQRGHVTTALDFSPAMIDALNEKARQLSLPVTSVVGDGQALPFASDSFDATFSMFGLIFFPERARGFKEMLRVLKPDGVAIISSWLPMERFIMLSDIFVALRKLLPNLPFGGGTAPLGDAESIIQEMTLAGFESVAVEEVSATAVANSLEEAWEFMSRGSAPFKLLERNLGDAVWQSVQKGILEDLRAKYGSGRQELTMVANLGIGRKP
jgi:SAM-dependent methyltransferase